MFNGSSNSNSNSNGSSNQNSFFKPTIDASVAPVSGEGSPGSPVPANTSNTSIAPPSPPAPDTAGYDYDPASVDTRWESFRIPSQDQHGHSERVQTRIQPGHMRMLQNFVAAKAWGYRDSGDVIRHAIDRHIRWLESFGYPIPSVTAQVDAAMHLMNDHTFNMEYRTLFETLQGQVQEYLNLGGVDEAVSLIVSVRGYLLDMPDGPWKKRYLETIQGRFGYMIPALPVPVQMDLGDLGNGDPGIQAGTSMSMDMFVPGLND